MAHQPPEPPEPVTSSGPGRSTLLSKELQDSICNDIREGLTLELAAERAGIGRRTMGEWVQRGTDPHHPRGDRDGIFRKFAIEVKRARADWAPQAVRAVQHAVPPYPLRDDPAAHTKMLERLLHDDYGAHRSKEPETEQTGPSTIVVNNLHTTKKAAIRQLRELGFNDAADALEGNTND